MRDRAGGGGSSSAAAQREAFFATLPQDEFTALETSLRQVLLDWLGSRPAPFTFPLIEWIDRRLGGEVATGKDENGQGEIRLQSTPADTPAITPAVTPEAFFAGLPKDSFTPEEEALRDSIFDFLAAWKSQELADFESLNADRTVSERCTALLPSGVRLDAWIEQRIGGEVELRKDPTRPGKDVIHLHPAARPIVTSKYKEMQQKEKELKEVQQKKGLASASAMPSPTSNKGGGKGAASAPAAAGPAREPRIAASGPATSPTSSVLAASSPAKGAAKGGGKSGGKKPAIDKEEWFSALPTDQLTAEEAALREALLGWLADWPRRRPGNKPPSAPIYFQDAGQDADVQRKRAALLPSSVPLREWIDRRVGGEIELRKDEQGNTEILVRGSKPPGKSGADGVASGGSGAGVGAKATRQPPEGAASGPNKSQLTEDFFKRLPSDELTPEELDLRQAVLDLIESHSDQVSGIPLSLVSKDKLVEKACTVLMPPEVPLRLWLERRVGGEVEVSRDEKGSFALRMRRSAEDISRIAEDNSVPKGAAKEQFFAELPEDRFTPDEERLRSSLLDFLENWKGNEAPNLSHAGGDNQVRRSRALVLPEGAPVSLKDWIDRRMGGEIEMIRDGAGQYVFGVRGTLDADAASRKRPREGREFRDRGNRSSGGSGKGDHRSSAGAGKGGKKEGGGAPWKKARGDDDDRGGRGPRPGMRR
mmetsp:Transcript_132172/g.342016  ORF Transcript_132172/g.342016 Transcript_132172/m.342016 type:complete len:706 (+) Transcript_132172:77-2194(+)